MYKLLKNWKVVILSIGGAATFWFFNALNKDYSARINYPIEFQFERDSVVVMEPLATTVTVDVSSGGWNLLRKTFLFNITPIQIDLDNPTEISFYTRASLFPLVSDQLDGLEVDALITDTIHINIEKKLRKQVVLVLDSASIPMEQNYRITSPIKFSIDTIELIGPKSYIDTLKTTFTFGLGEKKIDDSFNKEVDIQVPNAQLISVMPNKTTVSFQVERFDEVKVSVPIELVNFPSDSSTWVDRDKVDVIFMVQKSKKELFKPRDFAVTVDLSMRNKQDSTVMAMLIFYPEELVDVRVVPEFIRLSNE